VVEGESLPEPLASMKDTEVELVTSMATAYLWNWTDRRYGLCEITLRPCQADCDGRAPTFFGRGPYPGLPGGGGGAPWTPALVGGSWYNIACGTCGATCTCANGPESLALPGPVADVVEVLVDGAVVDPALYEVQNSRYLVRLDGSSWPRCQDMLAPTSEVGTFSVTYNRGVEVPAGGQIAAGVLALELAKAWCKDNTCALPQRIQSITRQGVTIAMIDSFEDVEKGHTGIWIIDAWVVSVTKPRVGGTVHSVDLRGPRHGRVTTWRSP
jgi:hypothetical protein